MNLFDDIVEIDELIYSKRKTISIIIDRDAKVTVRAPIKASMEDINTFIRLKSNWINKKKLEVQMQINKRNIKHYISGEKFLFMGIEYPLLYSKDCINAIEFNHQNFIMDIKYKTQAAAIFKKWYKKAANIIISDKLSDISKTSGLSYKSFKINSAKSRWGSCSSKKTLNFSYRLILTPEFVIDYILIHELCHTIEMNHSAKFWKLVQLHYPDFKKAEHWLTKNSHSIDV